MFSSKSLFFLFALAKATSAIKFDCWNTLNCNGNPGGSPGNCGCEVISDANKCTDGFPCNQAASPEGCFVKGALSASVWGDNSKCFMNKYDCWTDCKCSKDDYLDEDGKHFDQWYNPANVHNPANAMGNGISHYNDGKGGGITGWEACFAAGATSASIWGASFNGAYIEAGQYIPTPNYTVTADTMFGGHVVEYQCEVNPESTCQGGGRGWGDPHFTTQDGEIYDFQGECDLVFLEAPTMDLSMHVRTKMNDQNSYSYIEAAAISLNGETVEIGDYGSIIINGIYNADDRELPKTVGGFPLEVERSDKKTHTYRIIIDPNMKHYIELKSFTFMVGVAVELPKEDMVGATGLFGSAKRGGAKLGRDGVTLFADVDAFGKEWVVGPEDPALFEADPEHPGVCVMPKNNFMHTKRLGGITIKQAEAACAGMGLNKAACVTDVMASNDVGMASAF